MTRLKSDKRSVLLDLDKPGPMEKLNCILLVDDDAATNYLNKSFITRFGLAKYVFEVTDGQDALDFILRKGAFRKIANQYPLPDLILLDINMSNLDGFEFLEEYHRLDPKFRSAPIVLLSTSDRKPDFQKARSFPMVADYLVKPIRRDTWKQILKAVK